MARSMAAYISQIVWTLSLLATIGLWQFQAAAGESECSDPLSTSLSSSAASLLQVQKHAVHEHSKVQSAASKRRKIQQNDAPCQCEADNNDWNYATVSQAGRPPRCIFIDLGAANGNTFENFIQDGYGSVLNCPSGGSWQAVLVEANPRFNDDLREIQKTYSNAVSSLVGTAAYMCAGTTSFFLDDVDVKGNVSTNYWGSSMSTNAQDVNASGFHKVSVPMVNVMRLIAEVALPEDYVVIKMDIEGSEHDIIPCLAQSSTKRLVDALYVEKHDVSLSLAHAVPGNVDKVIAQLQSGGMYIPEYSTPTF